MFGGLSTTELLIILGLILLIFGAKRVPEMARSLGKGLSEVRRVRKKVEDDVGIGQLRRVTTEVLHEVKEVAGNGNVTVDLNAKPEIHNPKSAIR